MRQHAEPQAALMRTALDIAPWGPLLALVSIACLAASIILSGQAVALPLLLVGGSLGMLCLLVGLAAVLNVRRHGLQRGILGQTLEHERVPALATSEDGAIFHANTVARARFAETHTRNILDVLMDLVATPGPLVHRLVAGALDKGSVSEDVALRRGALRLSVQHVGRNCFVWRLSDIAEAAVSGGPIAGVAIPMLAATKSGEIEATNDAFLRKFGQAPESLRDLIGQNTVPTGAPCRMTTRNGPERVTLHEIVTASGRREVYVLPPQDAPAPGGDWQFFDALPVAMLKIGQAGEVQMANRLARELLAHRAPLGCPLSDLVEGLGRPVSDWLDDATKGHGLNRSEVVRAIHPAKDVFLQITLGRIEDEGETVLVAVLNDATELKSLEAQFVQSQKMQAIGQLAGGVAHDFNNLLTAISGHCDLMLLRHDEGDPDYGDLIQIHQNANRAASLVGQLLAFSRKQNLQLELLDLRDTMSDLTHLLNRLVGEKVRLELDHDPDLKLVRADKRQIEQVMMNLVVNARDAMPKGGAIRIRTLVQHLAEGLARDRVEVPPGDYVVVRVSDEGVGIPGENISKIFEPFFSTKKPGEGTGLGLSTVYGIVKQTGGFIFADSTAGEGTTFTIYLRAQEKQLPIPEAATSPAAQMLTGHGEGVVLLVEDEAPVRAFASRALRMRGYTVLEADSAETALELLEDESLAIDVFVTDVVMPGMDGPSWVREALKQRPDTRVVFVSGYAEDSVAESQARIPNSVFLPKPFSLNELTATVQSQTRLH